MAALDVNEKNRLFRVDAVGLYDECSDYHKTIAEVIYSSLVMKPKIFCRLVASLSSYLHTCSYWPGVFWQYFKDFLYLD